MNAKNSVRKAVVGIALVCISVGHVWADKLQLQARLSKEVKIELRDVTIAEALEKIGKKAGVKFVLSDEAAWKLPQGEATRLSVMLDGPLAESMTEMLNAFFMRYAVGDEEITIYPRPELDHILGRPTTKQLDLLRTIYTKAFKTYHSPRTLTSEILGQEVLISPVGRHSDLRNFLSSLRTTVRRSDGTEIYELIISVTLAQVFDSYTSAWYLCQMEFPNQIPEIRLVSSPAFRAAKLDQIVDISFKEEKAEVIIQRLANRTGMELRIDKRDPSWLEGIITVDMQNVKLRQALRNVVSTVDGDVRIDVKGNEIRMVGPRHKKKAAAPKPSGSAGYVGKISIPMDGGKYYIEFMLREKDLTEELKKLREAKMKAILGESPKPARKPKPAAKSK